jgi:SOS response regulatory protein OraA/RecX
VTKSRSAVDAALAALRHRDLSTLEIEQRLAAKGFSDGDRGDAVATLQRTGMLDDRRFAEGRASSLAARGAGDLLIRDALVRVGIEAELVDEAIAALEPEPERARIVVAKRGATEKTARYLSSKGFAYETVASVVANEPAQEIG